MTRPPKEALGSLQSLQNLYMNDNQLRILEKNAFGNLPVVSHLELRGNMIHNISYAAFESLRQLTQIDLSFNNLSWVPPGAFFGNRLAAVDLTFRVCCNVSTCFAFRARGLDGHQLITQ